jgi:PAS domain S-box-containing protein
MSDGVLKALITTEPEETNEPAWGRDGLTKSILDGLTAGIAILDDSGKIIFVNESWRRYAEASHLVVSDHLVVSNHGIGMNYLEVCESKNSDSQGEQREIANGIREIISGKSDEFYMEYPCHGPNEKRWLSVRATRIEGEDPTILLLVYNDVTEKKVLEEESEEIKDELGERVKELTAMHKISRVLQDTEKPTAEVLGEITYILPSAWEYPEITAARIIFDKHEFTTPNFYPTPWNQSVDFETRDGKRLVVEVVYLAERPSEHEGPFLLEERSLISSLSEMLNAYLERKLIQGDLKENVARLAKKTRYGEIISTVTSSIHRSINLQDVLENAVESMRKNIDKADNVSVYLVEGKEAVLKAYRGYSASYVERVARIPFPKGASWRTIIDGKPRYVADVEKDSIIGPAGKLAGTKSYLSMPIRIEDKVVGCIHVHSLQKNAFDEEELKLMEIVAQQIEAAIKNAQQAKMLSEREEQYRVLFEQSSVGVFVFDKEFNITQCNKRLVEIMGSDFNRLIGLNLLELRDKSFTPALYRVLEGQSSYYEGFYEATTGTAKLWLSLRLSPLRDVNGEVVGGMGIVEDVSERMQNEKQLHLHKTALEAAANGIVITDREGTIVWVNPAVTRLTGYSAEELIGENPRIFKSGEQDNDLYQNLWNTIISGQVWKGEMVNRRKDGSFYIEEMTITPVRFGGSEVSHFIAVKRDITERKRAEELIKSHVRLQTAIARLGQIALAETDLPNLMNELVSLVAQTLEVEYCKVLELLPDGQAFILRAGVGWKEGCVGHSIVGRETESQAGYTLLSGEPVVVEDLRTEKRFNGPTLLHDHGILSGISVIIAGHDKPFGVLGAHSTGLRKFTSDDISFLQTVANVLAEAIERKLSEEKIREQATLLDVARDAIMVRDLEHRVMYWNRSAERLYGWTAEEAVGKNALGFLFRGEVSPVFEAHKDVIEKGEWTGELHQVTKDGREITVDSHWTIVRDEEGRPKSIFIVNTDITEKKRLESEFLRSQRMESIGTLAGGIAHDLNNVFQPIMMVSQLLRMRFSDEKSIGLIETLEASAERGANLVRQVLSFARGAEGEHSIIQVRHIISEIDKILKETFPKSIEITTDVPKNLWPISADPTQFHQVMMNLCVNARDAMPNGGALKIHARDFIADENYARMNIEAKAGPYIVIDVTDSGVGIPSEIIDRIFEPFFTTKEPGKGTGLGLSTVFRIVKDHGGFVRVYSEVGKGTKFSVYLPAADTTETRHLAKKQIENLPTGNGELILVVDDEASVREIAKISLVTNGYQAVTANDGAEAIALYVQKRKEIKAVVLDVVMPIMDGPACIRALKKIDPAVKIILVSGLKENSNLVKVENTDIAAFLTKPYTTETLLMTLKEVLTA